MVVGREEDEGVPGFINQSRRRQSACFTDRPREIEEHQHVFKKLLCHLITHLAILFDASQDSVIFVCEHRIDGLRLGIHFECVWGAGLHGLWFLPPDIWYELLKVSSCHILIIRGDEDSIFQVLKSSDNLVVKICVLW
ncbi:MAG: hypothetical protein RLZZ347_813 [Candidatus Parcubacteria bacterium]|jgi:hypothetical protein